MNIFREFIRMFGEGLVTAVTFGGHFPETLPAENLLYDFPAEKYHKYH